MKCAFQNEQTLFLVMDYLRGADLRYHICYKNTFTQRQIKFILANILVALEYIHSNKIIHKDIKPQNLVFEENGYLRITDFGIAKSQLSDKIINARNQSSGTPVYMAPEVLFKKDYSYQSDFYALGVIIYELAMGKRPYEGKNRTQIKQQLIDKDTKMKLEDLPLGWSQNLVDLVNQLLSKNPVERLGSKGVHKIKQHMFFADINWKKLEKKQLKPPFIPNVVCEMKQYLDQIIFFDQINQKDNQNQQNFATIDKETNDKFKQYDFERLQFTRAVKVERINFQKCKRTSQTKLLY